MVDNQNTKDRLIQFIKTLGIGQGKFEKNCGLSNGWVNNIKATIKDDKLQKILQNYPRLNSVWLLTGEGTMFREDATAIDYTEPSVYDDMSAKLAEANANLEKYKQLTQQQSNTIDSQQKLIEVLQKQLDRIESLRNKNNNQ